MNNLYEVSVTSRVRGTPYEMTLRGWSQTTATRMLSFLSHRGFDEVTELVEPSPETFVTAEGKFPFYPLDASQ